MADFNLAIEAVIGFEGGSWDDPRGGPTKYGITRPTLEEAKRRGLVPRDRQIRDLTVPEAKTIYRVLYWNEVRGDEIRNQVIAGELPDTAVNCGQGTAVKLAQRALNFLGEHLVEDVAHLVLVSGALEERDGLTGEDRDGGRDSLDLERLSDLRVCLDVDSSEEHRPLVAVDEAPEGRREPRVRLVGRDPQEHDDGDLHRLLDDLLERRLGRVDDEAACGGSAAGLARGRSDGAPEGREVDRSADVEPRVWRLLTHETFLFAWVRPARAGRGQSGMPAAVATCSTPRTETCPPAAAGGT